MKSQENKMKTRTSRMMMVAAMSLPLAGSALAGISGSKHDFSGNAWARGEICLPCHAPHNNKNTSGNTLWNHADTTANFTMYSSGSMNATMPSGPSAGSKTCLSCHDGTVALDSFGANTGTNFLANSNKNYLSSDLANDHPISFTYNTSLATADGFLKDPATANSGLGNKIAQDMLINGKVECSSCHDVHNQYNVSPGMLKKSNAGSALCITCHSK
jgi:predicted CXXCH cytochrome family protein